MQDIVISDQLDTSKVDLSSLVLGPIMFEGHVVTPPPLAQSFFEDVDCAPCAT
ncbi:MAG TPA: hypothetical protein VEL28_01665 [Candidatus Binatia bacterium]|nr:hypothetical protein [Candidatus Binatia bacterium]